MAATIARPRPNPPPLLASARWKRWNTRLRSGSGMPGPESSTAMQVAPSSTRADSCTPPPSGANRIALSSRLPIASNSRPRSPITPGRSASNSSSNTCPFSSASGA
ncbi:hypothetical protein G6F59_018612 [Rhizopus arrhizus]|nr:hypothetical protein G6F59_018612 [Rhizopus arrhizus]